MQRIFYFNAAFDATYEFSEDLRLLYAKFSEIQGKNFYSGI